ncbi:MAG: peptidoglycan-binding protein [Sedimentisphaerales bacterium]|nr:peptidoglycan-binding protein [Sedimentisphaerales bacterium]
MAEHTVKQGDCIASIAMKYGFWGKTLWNLSENSELKKIRKDPNILLPGDTVFIPEKEIKEESCETEKKHRFRRKGVPEKLRIVLKVEGEPRADAKCHILIDGRLTEDVTDSEGRLTIAIPPNAQKGKVTLVDGGEEFELDLGGLDPITEITGVQARLANLGFDLDVTGHMDQKTKDAIKEFQRRHDLTVTDELNDDLRNKLKEVFGA